MIAVRWGGRLLTAEWDLLQMLWQAGWHQSDMFVTRWQLGPLRTAPCSGVYSCTALLCTLHSGTARPPWSSYLSYQHMTWTWWQLVLIFQRRHCHRGGVPWCVEAVLPGPPDYPVWPDCTVACSPPVKSPVQAGPVVVRTSHWELASPLRAILSTSQWQSDETQTSSDQSHLQCGVRTVRKVSSSVSEVACWGGGYDSARGDCGPRHDEWTGSWQIHHAGVSCPSAPGNNTFLILTVRQDIWQKFCTLWRAILSSQLSRH